jgi:hypothetical protein
MGLQNSRDMNEELFELSKVLNEDIVDIIRAYQLNTPSRKQEIVSKRYYLYNYMYENRHMTTTMIGQYFNRDHSTVVHGIQEHKYWYHRKDQNYLKMIYPIPELIRPKRADINIFDVDVMPIDDEETRVTITGNFPTKLLKSFQERMTRNEISTTFELS